MQLPHFNSIGIALFLLVFPCHAFAAMVAGPEISSLSPADNATGVAVSGNLEITFSAEVMPMAGADNDIIIMRASDDAVVETIDALDGKVTGSGTAIITINPDTTLDDNTSYYVLIGEDAFDDLFESSFFGIADTTTWNFTTGDFTAPILSSLSPAHNATAVSTGATIT